MVDERPHKMVNGEKVFLTDAEIAKRQQEDEHWLTVEKPKSYIKSIKEIAQQRILAIAPEYEQRNKLAQAIELAAIPDSERTQSQKDEALELKTMWAKINDIRRHSNALEAQIKRGNYPNLRDQTSQGWPA